MTAQHQLAPPTEARKAPRERALLQARVSYAGGAMSFSCVVTQISTTGVKIVLNGETALPDHFQIAIPQRGIDSAARLVWRRAGHVGIAFDAAVTVAPEESPGLQARLQALETENRALRATIAEMTARLKNLAVGY